MELFSLCLIGVAYITIDGKLNRLVNRVNKVSKDIKGEKVMSKMLNDLVGKTCNVEVHGGFFETSTVVKYDILDVDEDWVKVSSTSKKGVVATKLLRIDDIISIVII